jgi:hypothetical protein
VSNIKTSCEMCIFRKNLDDGVQNGCSLDRLNIFLERGEARKEKDFYIIDRFCNTCRNKDYTEESILKEVEISCTFIVYGANDFWITLKSILKQTIKPKAVFVVFDDQKMFNKEKYKEFQEIYKNSEIQLIFKRWLEPTDYLKMIDEVVLKCNTQFYIPIKGNIDKNFIKKLNDRINYDLIPTNAYFTQNSIFNSLISCSLHKMLNGNKEIPLKEKLEELVKDKSEKERSTIVWSQ